MEWLKKLSNAIEYVEDNLDKKISYEEAAHIAGCSTYYFQRMFSYVVGLSLSEYIRRRRMSQAAFELQGTNQKVLDISLKYGYSSPTSFNRAFQRVHGITPILARNPGSKLNLYPPIHFSVNITGGSVMSYHIEKKKCIRVVGIKTPLTEDIEENMRDVPIFWEQTLLEKRIPEIYQISNGCPDGILGVSVYKNPDDIYYYIAVPSKEDVPGGMAEYIIPEATWAVFENDGPFKESVQNIFKRFFTEFLPFSGYQYAQLPDVEVYPITREKGHSEVWFAIEKKGD